jgi:hypothetical protein
MRRRPPRRLEIFGELAYAAGTAALRIRYPCHLRAGGIIVMRVMHAVRAARMPKQRSTIRVGLAAHGR